MNLLETIRLNVSRAVPEKVTTFKFSEQLSFIIIPPNISHSLRSVFNSLHKDLVILFSSSTTAESFPIETINCFTHGKKEIIPTYKVTTDNDLIPLDQKFALELMNQLLVLKPEEFILFILSNSVNANGTRESLSYFGYWSSATDFYVTQISLVPLSLEHSSSISEVISSILDSTDFKLKMEYRLRDVDELLKWVDLYDVEFKAESDPSLLIGITVHDGGLSNITNTDFNYELNILTFLNKIRLGQKSVSDWNNHHNRKQGISVEGIGLLDGVYSNASDRELDFSEKVFLTALKALNMQDLMEFMNLLAENLETNKLTPKLRKDNYSEFADLLRNCIRLNYLDYDQHLNLRAQIGQQFNELITEQGLVVMLIEVGIEKLKYDFYTIMWKNDMFRKFLVAESKSETLFRLLLAQRMIELKHFLESIGMTGDLRGILESTLNYWKKRLEDDSFNNNTEPFELNFPLKATGPTVDFMNSILKSTEPHKLYVKYDQESSLLVMKNIGVNAKIEKYPIIRL